MKKVQIMGIINCTPDSFYDGGQFFDPEKALAQAEKLIAEGADILDIGGESTRPFSDAVECSEEKRRILPLIKALKGRIPLSIDTMKPEVAMAALESGADIINDVTGLHCPKMRAIVKNANCPLVMMHMQGDPKTMQIRPHYPRGVVTEIMEWFQMKLDLLEKEGFDLSKIILDPGIGFGKSTEDCLSIIQNIPTFKSLGMPLLIGLSRKAFQSKILQKPSSALLSTTVALNTMSLYLGCDIIRVHDVLQHREVIQVLQRFPDEFFNDTHSRT